MKISFIIPVYKVELYLRQCVESLSSQTFQDIEVILVDDGSPDGSPDLCDKLAEEDERILVIHKENGGLSDARNTGLLAATGDYVVFVDGDDFWLSPHYLQVLVDKVTESPSVDFVGFNCKYYYPCEERYAKWLAFPGALSQPVSKDVAMYQLSKAGIFPVSACMKLIKREFLIGNQLFFKKGQLSEDIPWFINLIDSCSSCIFLNEYVYAYRRVDNGSSISHNIGVKNVNCLTQIIKNELTVLPQRIFNKEAKEALLSFLAYELIQTYSCLHSLDKKDAKKFWNELKEYNWLFAYTLNPKVSKVALMRSIIGLRPTLLLIRYYVKLR